MKFINKYNVIPSFKEMLTILNKNSVDYRIFNKIEEKDLDKVLVFNTDKGLWILGFMNDTFIKSNLEVNPSKTYQLQVIKYDIIDKEFSKIYYKQFWKNLI